MGWLSFILQYVTAPRSVGAVAPSSRYLARKMMQTIDFETAKCIVEFGPGTGVFTQEILQRRRLGTVVIIIERNADFCAQLRKKFATEQELHIIEGSAEKIGEYLHQCGFTHADSIVSGLPFATLPAETGTAILTQAKTHLHKEGRFITFQYSLLRKGLIARHFRSIEITREWRNLPPAYVLSCW
ncbi:MAG: methyltransferase [Defluviitaleaceae bacterium]|nr:methyltransferase [Defluviitaleaceae bacterium]